MAAQDRHRSSELRPSTVFAGYRIRGRLGSGGMGVVYRAVQLSLGRAVALKVLNSELALDATARRRFVDEGRLAARVSHPRVVRPLDVGEVDGRLFLVYELIEGPTLRARLDDAGALPFADALEVVDACAEALVAIHRHGVLHRDLKPGNVFLEPERGALVGDLGLAKDLLGGGPRTSAGLLLGTPAYLAPELIGGEPASPASDFYALGVLLFECLTGRLPFEADDVAELLRLHVEMPPPGLGGLLPRPAPALEELTGRLLSKTPAERPNGEAVRRVLAAARSAAGAPETAGTVLPTLRKPSARLPSAKKPDTDRTVTDGQAGRPRRVRSRLVLGVGGAAAALLFLGLWVLRGGPGPVAVAPSPEPPAVNAAPRVEASWKQLSDDLRGRLDYNRGLLVMMTQRYEALGSHDPAVRATATTAGPLGVFLPGRAEIRPRVVHLLSEGLELTRDCLEKVARGPSRDLDEIATHAGRHLTGLYWLWEAARLCLEVALDRLPKPLRVRGSLLLETVAPTPEMAQFDLQSAAVVGRFLERLPPGLRASRNAFWQAGLAAIFCLGRPPPGEDEVRKRWVLESHARLSRALLAMADRTRPEWMASLMVADLLSAMKTAGMDRSRAQVCAQALRSYPDDEPVASRRPRDELTRYLLVREGLGLQYRVDELDASGESRRRAHLEGLRKATARLLCAWPYDFRRVKPPLDRASGPLRDALELHVLASDCYRISWAFLVQLSHELGTPVPPEPARCGNG